jgi:hypothetical protein
VCTLSMRDGPGAGRGWAHAVPRDPHHGRLSWLPDGGLGGHGLKRYAGHRSSMTRRACVGGQRADAWNVLFVPSDGEQDPDEDAAGKASEVLSQSNRCPALQVAVPMGDSQFSFLKSSEYPTIQQPVLGLVWSKYPTARLNWFGRRFRLHCRRRAARTSQPSNGGK